jgi:hypothetical protein
MQTWTEQDFDAMTWHDCHVHSWGLAEAAHGQADFTLDIDFITAWENPGDGTLAFRVAPATLVFFAVFAFQFEIDYTGCAVTPFSIDGIARELRVNEAGYRDYLYRLQINWPRGFFTFSGDRFRQSLRAEPIVTRSQHLEPDERVALLGGA